MDIQKLMKKESWTGKELGLIQIVNSCYLFKGQCLVTTDQFYKMYEASDITEYDRETYYKYTAIFSWLAEKQVRKNNYAYHLNNLVTTLNRDLVEVSLYENIQLTNAQYPLIMTEGEYTEAKEKAISDFCKKGHRSTPLEMAEYCLYSYIDFFKEREKDNTLHLLSNELVNGKVCWTERENVPVGLLKILDKYCNEPLIKDCLNAYECIEIASQGELKKSELIGTTFLLDAFSLSASYLQKNTKKQNLKNLQGFLDNYREMVEWLLNDIAEKFGYKDLIGLPEEKLIMPYCPSKELYMRDFYGIRSVLSSDWYAFKDDINAFYSGIAIIKKPTGWIKYPVENNHYVKPEPFESDKEFNLLNLSPEKHSYMLELPKILKKELNRVEAYNCLIDLIIEVYKIKELAYLKHDMTPIYESIDAYNKTYENISFTLCNQWYVPYKEAQIKQENLSKYYSYISKEVVIEEDLKQRVKELLKDLSTFQHNSKNGNEIQRILLNGDF